MVLNCSKIAIFWVLQGFRRWFFNSEPHKSQKWMVSHANIWRSISEVCEFIILSAVIIMLSQDSQKTLTKLYKSVLRVFHTHITHYILAVLCQLCKNLTTFCSTIDSRNSKIQSQSNYDVYSQSISPMVHKYIQKMDPVGCFSDSLLGMKPFKLNVKVCCTHKSHV